MRGREDDKKRMGKERWTLWGRDLLCHKEEGRSSEGERCREGSTSTERWRVFENLTGSNGDEKDESGGSKAGR